VFKNGEDFVPRDQRPHPVPFKGLIISSESCVGGDPLSATWRWDRCTWPPYRMNTFPMKLRQRSATRYSDGPSGRYESGGWYRNEDPVSDSATVSWIHLAFSHTRDSQGITPCKDPAPTRKEAWPWPGSTPPVQKGMQGRDL